MRTETDTELCRVTDMTAKQKVMYALMKAGVPYAEEWEKVPVLKRKKYNGAKEVCVVITHSDQVNLAKSVIRDMDDAIHRNIVW